GRRDGLRRQRARGRSPRGRELPPSPRPGLSAGPAGMEDFGLTFLIVGAGILALPFLSPKNNRVRTILFGVCIVLTWRYVWWRVAETLPPFELRFDSLFAWGFSTVEGLAVVGWTVSFITLSRTKDRSREATEQCGWLEESPSPPRVDVLIATDNEEAGVSSRTSAAALGGGRDRMQEWVWSAGL